MISSLPNYIGRKYAGALLANNLTNFDENEPTWFDHDAPGLTFYRYLAEWHGWNTEFVWKVIDEYKRFIALLIKDEHPVVPPPAVDIVWRLHRQYDRSYALFCRSIMTKLAAEAAKSSDTAEVTERRLRHVALALQDHDLRTSLDYSTYCGQYRGTVGFYLEVFGHPPMDIWGKVPATISDGW